MQPNGEDRRWWEGVQLVLEGGAAHQGAGRQQRTASCDAAIVALHAQCRDIQSAVQGPRCAFSWYHVGDYG